jgi:hypothetical protein
MPKGASSEVWDRGFEEDELVLVESFLESLRRLAASCASPEAFLRSTFLVAFEPDRPDGAAEAAAGLEADRPEFPLPTEPHD